MTEYLIAFNDEWVPDYTVEEFREKADAMRALRAEMKPAGVLIYTNGLDDDAPVFVSVLRAARHCSLTVRTSSPRNTSAASPS